MPPWMSFRAALVIWMSSTAMKAPRIAPKIAIQSRAVGCRSSPRPFIARRSFGTGRDQGLGALRRRGAGIHRDGDRKPRTQLREHRVIAPIEHDLDRHA